MSKHAAPDNADDLFRVQSANLTPHQAVNLASRLLHFATQEGTK